jgi:hypothetical protein
MDTLFDMLRMKNIITHKGVKASTVESLPLSQILDTASEIVNATRLNIVNPNRTIFSYSASYSVGGGREACASLNHRITRLDELARFALMYSDQVYINNFFSEYSHYENADIDFLRRYFFEDVYLLTCLEPLLQVGLLSFFSPPVGCIHQWTKRILNDEAEKKLNREERRLKKEYLTKTSITLRQKDDKYKLDCNAPEPYIEHGTKVFTYLPNTLPKPLLDMPRIINRVRKGESVPLSESVRRKLGFHEENAFDVIENVSYEVTTSQLLNTSFLTSNELHISCLKSITGDPDIEERNAIAQKHLTSIIPFINDVEINDLIKLRNREAESFNQYRRALNEAIDEFRANTTDFKEKDARALYSDVIAPRLSALDRNVKNAKKDLIRKASKSVIAVTSAISFGIYTGLIPTEIAELAKVVGLTKIVADIVEKALPLGEAVSTIKNDDLYFLWKVKKKADQS